MSDEMKNHKLKLSENIEKALNEPKKISMAELIDMFNRDLFRLVTHYAAIPPYIKSGIMANYIIQPVVIDTIGKLEPVNGVQEEDTKQEETGNSSGGEVQTGTASEGLAGN